MPKFFAIKYFKILSMFVFIRVQTIQRNYFLSIFKQLCGLSIYLFQGFSYKKTEGCDIYTSVCVGVYICVSSLKICSILNTDY